MCFGVCKIKNINLIDVIQALFANFFCLNRMFQEKRDMVLDSNLRLGV